MTAAISNRFETYGGQAWMTWARAYPVETFTTAQLVADYREIQEASERLQDRGEWLSDENAARREEIAVELARRFPVVFQQRTARPFARPAPSAMDDPRGVEIFQYNPALGRYSCVGAMHLSTAIGIWGDRVVYDVLPEDVVTED
jgi:hypothetical protein